MAGVSLITTLETYSHFTSNRLLSAICPSLSVSLLGRFGLKCVTNIRKTSVFVHYNTTLVMITDKHQLATSEFVENLPSNETESEGANSGKKSIGCEVVVRF